MLILLLISLLGYCVFMTKYWRWPIETTPFFTVSSIISLLFIFGLFDFLRPGAYLIFGTGLALFIWCDLSSRKNFNKTALEFLASITPGLVFFILFYFLLWYRVHGSYYIAWDDLCNWAVRVKDFILTNALIEADSIATLKDYPPGAGLFQYFVSLIVGYSEGATFFAQGILILAAFTSMFQSLKWKHLPVALVTAFFCYLIVFILGYNFETLYVDAVLAVFFGMALAGYFLSRTDKNAVFRLIPVVFCMPLLKQMGFFFAAIVAVVVLSDRLICAITEYKKKGLPEADGSANKKLRPHIIAAIGLSLLLFVSLFLSTGSWSYHVKKKGFEKTFEVDLSFTRIKNSFSKTKAVEKDKIIIANFRKALNTIPIGAPATGQLLNRVSKAIGLTSVVKEIPITTYRWIAILLIFFGITFFWQSSQEQFLAFLSCHIWLILFCIIYLGFLLVLYLHAFQEAYGKSLVSFARYTGTYLLGWSLVSFAFILNGLQKRSWKRILPIATLIAIVPACLFAAPSESLSFLTHQQSMRTDYHVPRRKHIRKLLHNAEEKIGKNDKLYVIWQNTDGIHKWIIIYEWMPRLCNREGWIIGKSFTAEQFAKTLLQYDYLLLGNTDDVFWEECGYLFKDTEKAKEATLFKIDKKDDAGIRLIAN